MSAESQADRTYYDIVARCTNCKEYEIFTHDAPLEVGSSLDMYPCSYCGGNTDDIIVTECAAANL